MASNDTYLHYNGTQLLFYIKGESIHLAFKATSGIAGIYPDGTKVDFQNSAYQCFPDEGPIPAGRYKLYLKNASEKAKRKNSNTCNLVPQKYIQEIPFGDDAGDCKETWALWGKNRVRLYPDDNGIHNPCTIRRSGFYIHDSTKGYTHGCIETETRFFDRLREHAAKTKEDHILLIVTYYPKSSTYGGTYKP